MNVQIVVRKVCYVEDRKFRIKHNIPCLVIKIISIKWNGEAFNKVFCCCKQSLQQFMPLFDFYLHIHDLFKMLEIVVRNHLPTLILHPQVYANKRTKNKR